MRGDIIECQCGRRYMRTRKPVTTPERGEFRCACGVQLGAWDGLHTMLYEPEDGAPQKH